MDDLGKKLGTKMGTMPSLMVVADAVMGAAWQCQNTLAPVLYGLRHHLQYRVTLAAPTPPYHTHKSQGNTEVTING